MTHRPKVTIFVLVLLVHFWVLISLGISFITTSILCYCCLYLVIKWMVSKSSFTDKIKSSLKDKAKVFVGALVFIEVLLFLVPWTQTPTEKKYGIYVSTYKYPKIERLTNRYLNKDFRIMYEHGYVPYSKGRYKSKFSFDVDTEYNALGYRGKLPSLSKNGNETRICVLGDSYVEGHGVEDSLTMPYRLNQVLKERKDGFHYTVINGGLNGSDPISSIKMYHEKLQNYNSDIIVMVINISDLNDVKERGTPDKRYKGNQINYSQPSMSEYFAAMVRIYRLFHFVTAKLMTQKYEKEIEIIANECEKFRSTLNENIKFYVCYLPIKRRLNDESEIINQLEKRFSNSSFNFINLNNRYEEGGLYKSENYHEYFWRTDSHHTPKGYKFMAEAIASELFLQKN